MKNIILLILRILCVNKYLINGFSKNNVINYQFLLKTMKLLLDLQ